MEQQAQKRSYKQHHPKEQRQKSNALTIGGKVFLALLALFNVFAFALLFWNLYKIIFLCLK